MQISSTILIIVKQNFLTQEFQRAFKRQLFNSSDALLVFKNITGKLKRKKPKTKFSLLIRLNTNRQKSGN